MFFVDINDKNMKDIDKFRVSYDWLFDILYISLVNNEPSVTEENIDGIITRRSIESNILTGITILDLKKRLEENKCINNTEPEKKYMTIPFDEFKKVCKWHNDISCIKENVKCSNDTCHVLRTIDENNKELK